MDKNGGKSRPTIQFLIGGVNMDKINYVDTDSINTVNAVSVDSNYKASLNKALDNYFNLLSSAQKNERKRQAIIKNAKKRGKKK